MTSDILNFYFDLRKRLREKWSSPKATLWMTVVSDTWECVFLWSETNKKITVKISIMEIDWKTAASLVAKKFIAGEGETP